MKNQYRKWIGDRLKDLRKIANIDQEVFATMVGKNRPAYAAYEEGRAEPSILTLKKICDIHNITVDKFLEGCPTETAATPC